MRAQYIFENIKFERGQDPKEAMNIGDYNARKKKIISKILKFSPELANNYKGKLPYDMFINKNNMTWDIKVLNQITNNELINFLTYLQSQNIKESQNFERNKEPKVAMNIGDLVLREAQRKRKLLQPFIDAAEELAEELNIDKIYVHENFEEYRKNQDAIFVELKYFHEGSEHFYSIGWDFMNNFSFIKVSKEKYYKSEAKKIIRKGIQRQIEFQKTIKEITKLR